MRLQCAGIHCIMNQTWRFRGHPPFQFIEVDDLKKMTKPSTASTVTVFLRTTVCWMDQTALKTPWLQCTCWGTLQKVQIQKKEWTSGQMWQFYSKDQKDWVKTLRKGNVHSVAAQHVKNKHKQKEWSEKIEKEVHHLDNSDLSKYKSLRSHDAWNAGLTGAVQKVNNGLTLTHRCVKMQAKMEKSANQPKDRGVMWTMDQWCMLKIQLNNTSNCKKRKHCTVKTLFNSARHQWIFNRWQVHAEIEKDTMDCSNWQPCRWRLEQLVQCFLSMPGEKSFGNYEMITGRDALLSLGASLDFNDLSIKCEDKSFKQIPLKSVWKVQDDQSNQITCIVIFSHTTCLCHRIVKLKILLTSVLT